MNFFRRGKKEVVCPGCLARVRVTDETKQTCPNCSREIPIIYIQDYEKAPPIYIQVFGWTGHGKTFFLDSLRLIMMGMNPLWSNSGYYYQSLTQLDLETETALLNERQKGVPAGSTQRKTRDQNEVYIMKLQSMALWGSRMLVIMDQPGENFEKLAVPVKEIPYLVNTETTIMLISLNDLIANGGQNVAQLLNIYIQALLNAKVNFAKARRKLVIALTKADKIKGLPVSLKNYLADDTVWPIVDGTMRVKRPLEGIALEEYLERMTHVSDEIENWIRTDVRNVPGGGAMMAMLKQYNIEARFTLHSATGQELSSEVVGEESGFNIAPRRVLDTFLWALEFQSEKKGVR